MALIETYELNDRYRKHEGRVYLNGSQALARLPFDQLRADRRAGANTAAFVTGYPGSPLGNFDRDATAAAKLAAAEGLHYEFQLGLNEETAATAAMGAQLAVLRNTRRYDGVLSVWYAKMPGLDRASDALRHAVYTGTSPLGGALAVVGDDPTAKSSTVPGSCASAIIDMKMPLLYPGDVQETVELGHHAIALSRASGLWVGFKVVDSVADGTATVDLPGDEFSPFVPTREVDGRLWQPEPFGWLLGSMSREVEKEIVEVRLGIAREYCTANGINRVSVRGANDWVGIVAAGHTYREMREALRLMGFASDDDLRAVGIRLYQVGMPFPVDMDDIRRFADGLEMVLICEEKAENLEWLVKDALYGRTDVPVVYGKRGPDDSPLFPVIGGIDADIAGPILRRMLSPRLGQRLTPEPPAPRQLIPLSVSRTAHYCSGCPHNRSTKAPDGSLVGAGIGCHVLVLMMEPNHQGDIVGVTTMGNEGAQWIGMSPFVNDEHILQNLGDGTLFHSGLTAIRAAIASGVNITYKILYNGAVSMTGGQDPTGQLDVLSLCKVFLAEGIRHVIITTDDLSRYQAVDVPAGVRVWGRTRIEEAQLTLSAEPGVTILIHDQRCAAEVRRDRKRGRVATPNFRVVINERVCEGCGDCGDKSNCLSVQPVQTPFGRKTRIDQDSCNFDLTCMEGDCPAFMKVQVPEPGSKHALRKGRDVAPPQVPAPTLRGPGTQPNVTVRMTGIGGTGVVTVSQIIGTAATMQGLHVRGMDQTGLSQKAGPVVSDLRISSDAPLPSNRANSGTVDVLLAFDKLVGANDAIVRTLTPGHTVAVVNTAEVPTGSMVVHPERSFPTAEVDDRLDGSVQARTDVDAQAIVRSLLGDDGTVNVFVVGVAVQLGLVPVGVDFIERAIELNGAAVKKNLAAFNWGRAWAHDAEQVERLAEIHPVVDERPLLERLHDDLVGYQSAAYAARFDEVVSKVAALGHDELTEAIARHLHKVMAYKDEYEVARLLLLPSGRAQAESIGGRRARVTWMLHPPALRSLGWRNKIAFGRWSRPAFLLLRSMRRLRGTPFDVFGWAEVRRIEREMVPEYVAAIESMLPKVTPQNLAEAVAIASLPDRVRGYEHLKIERANAYRDELQRRLAAF